MGATENVFVEQLASRNSIEEVIIIINKRENTTLYKNGDKRKVYESDYCGDTVQSIYDTDNDHKISDQGNKVRFLLSNVKLIRPKNNGLSLNQKRKVSQKAGNCRQAKSVRFEL